MVKSVLKILFLFVLFGFLLIHSPVTQVKDLGLRQVMGFPDSLINREVNLDYGRIPLYFVLNEGQVGNRALFYAKTSGYTLWLTKNGLVFDSEWSKYSDLQKQKTAKASIAEETFERDISKLVFLNVNQNPKVIPLDFSEYKVNYFIGNDESKWRVNVPTSKAVLYRELYPNINFKVYGVEEQMEYDWIVKPGGEVSDIRFLLEGVKETRIDGEQNLAVETGFGELKHKKPECYQYIDGEKVYIEGLFHEIEENTYGIEVKKYNKDYELVIDPVILVYSTYLGGKKYDSGYGIAVDSEGAVYITGWTCSANFPTKNPFQEKYKGNNRNAFVTKINPEGSGLVYSTFLGGHGDDYTHDLAIDSKGSAYVTGKANSSDFPIKNPFQTEYKGIDDVFITKISPDGSELVFSSFLGGSGQDWGTGVTVDSRGSAYVTGGTTSADFPLKKAFQKIYKGGKTTYPWDAFITKIHPQGKKIVYSSYLGGDEGDIAHGIAVDSEGAAYVTGTTSSKNFPKKKPFQENIAGYSDAFICKIHKKGNRLLYSTYLGGSDWDNSRGIAVDSKGAAYVTGDTKSTDFPTQNPLQEVNAGGYDIFIAKIKQKGNKLVYSTYLGGNDKDRGYAIAVDSKGAAYITGETYSINFPNINSFQKNMAGSSDAFICKIHRKGNSFFFSTYLGGSSYETGYGIAVDAQGTVYVTGKTDSKNFPKKKAIQKKNRGEYDAFITKIQYK